MLERLEDLKKQIDEMIEEIKWSESKDITEKSNMQKLHDFIKERYPISDNYNNIDVYISKILSGYYEFYFGSNYLNIEFTLTSVDKIEPISSNITFYIDDLNGLILDTENDIINFLTEASIARLLECYKELKEKNSEQT